MSGGGQQQVGGAPQWLQDRASGLFDWAGDLAKQPYQQYQGQRVANQSPLQQLAYGGMQNLAFGSPAMSAAQDQLYTTMNGTANPYQGAVVDRVNSDVTDAFNRATAGTTARFNNAGGWGSDRHLMADQNNATALARGLGEGTAGVYSNDWNNERGRQLNAAALAPQLWNAQLGGLNTILGAGGQQQGYEQSLLNSQYGDWNDYQNSGWNNLGRVSSLFNGGAGNVFGQQRPGIDPISSGLGLITAGGSLKGGNGKSLGF